MTRTWLLTWPAALLVLLGACGDDGGDNDTLLTGFSGFVILCLVVWAVVHFAKKRGG